MVNEGHFLGQQVQDRLTAEMGKLMTTIKSLTDTHLAMSIFKKSHPRTFSGYYNPEEAKTWIRGMELIFEAFGFAEKYRVKLATMALIEEAEDWWNSIQPSMPTVGSIILWETFKDKFLETYVPLDVKHQGIEKGKEVETVERVQRNRNRNEGRNQKPYTKPSAKPGKSQYQMEQRMGCYRCGGPHMQRNCTLTPPPECRFCGKKGHQVKHCRAMVRFLGNTSEERTEDASGSKLEKEDDDGQ
jgi:Retrotransposon gag protein